MKSFVVLDLETTGLHPKTDRILEIGAIKVCDGKVIDTFTTFVNPRMEIPRYIVELTGITQEMAQTGMGNEDAVRAFITFCEGYPLMGHNILFDYSFIKHSAVNLGLNFEKEGMDTLHIARKLLPELESRKLGDLCEYFHIEHEQAHRALEDVKMTYKLYEMLIETYYTEHKEAFIWKKLLYQVKKQGPITKYQKAYLIDLLKYHKIDCNVEIGSLTKNEASRMIDKIILKHGRVKR